MLNKKVRFRHSSAGLATTPTVLTALSPSTISVYPFHISLSLRAAANGPRGRWPHVLATAGRLDNFRAALSKYL